MECFKSSLNDCILDNIESFKSSLNDIQNYVEGVSLEQTNMGLKNEELLSKLSLVELDNQKLNAEIIHLEVVNADNISQKLDAGLKLDAIVSKLDNVELIISKVIDKGVYKPNNLDKGSQNDIIKFYDFELEKANNELSLKNKKILS